jgi:molecular chaperone GrpE
VFRKKPNKPDKPQGDAMTMSSESEPVKASGEFEATNDNQSQEAVLAVEETDSDYVEDFSELDAQREKTAEEVDDQAEELSAEEGSWEDDLLSGLREDVIASASRIKELEAEVSEQKANYLRSVADLDNFRKRNQKERLDMMKYQGEEVIRDLLEVLDNLELAISYQDSDQKQLLLGLQMVCKTFVDKLDRWGVRPRLAVGTVFDPATHAAISRISVPTEGHGVVINEIKKAYFYKDKLIRVGEAVVNEVVTASEGESEGIDASDSEQSE